MYRIFSGPVVAGRLSENPKWTVTLLESGPEQPAATDIPALLSSAIATKYDWQYTTTPQKNACLAFGGVCGWPRGKVLGGTAVLSGKYTSKSPVTTAAIVVICEIKYDAN